jgi:hypothetical protein
MEPDHNQAYQRNQKGYTPSRYKNLLTTRKFIHLLQFKTRNKKSNLWQVSSEVIHHHHNKGPHLSSLLLHRYWNYRDKYRHRVESSKMKRSCSPDWNDSAVILCGWWVKQRGWVLAVRPKIPCTNRALVLIAGYCKAWVREEELWKAKDCWLPFDKLRGTKTALSFLIFTIVITWIVWPLPLYRDYRPF